ncbi:MAG: trans-sulfuration enzyme family protein [Stenotrophobium sp.]
MKLETLAIHSGRRIDGDSGAVAPVLNLSTTFERAPDGSYPQGHVYARVSNPNRLALEECLAALEGGAAAAAFPSGTAAALAILQALSPGDHVIMPLDIYWGTAVILRDLLSRWGLQYTAVDQTDAGATSAALRPNTRMIWVETPSNPLMKIVDIRQMAQLAHGAGAQCVVDNTFATPVLQRPLELGADMVMHSTTKYLGGHSDIIGGAVIAKRADGLFERVRDFQAKGGAIPAPFDCWLLLRSIATLPWRVRAQCEHAARLAQFLAAHPRIEAVHYPGLASHPQHALAMHQMSGGGAMLSLQVRGGRDEALALPARVKLFTRATSLGGIESLIEHRASVEGPGTRTPENLLRISVGLEHIDDLVADLAQALG